jgi:hypothetical protein
MVIRTTFALPEARVVEESPPPQAAARIADNSAPATGRTLVSEGGAGKRMCGSNAVERKATVA